MARERQGTQHKERIRNDVAKEFCHAIIWDISRLSSGTDFGVWRRLLGVTVFE